MATVQTQIEPTLQERQPLRMTYGVREYWIIDSRPGRERADSYRLDETGQYELFASEDEEKVSSTVLPGFWIRPAWLWQPEPPEVLMTFFEMRGVPAELVEQMHQALRAGPGSVTAR